MKRLTACFLAALLLFSAAPALAAKGRFTRHMKRDPQTEEKITYYVYEPADLTDGLPLVVYLHGSSERGDNAFGTSLPLFVKNGTVLCKKALLLVPQLPDTLNAWSAIEETLMAIINGVIADYSVDESRIALTGFSLGALAVWDLAGHYPGRFTRVLPVAGRIDSEIYIDAFEMCQLKNYVGTRDETVDYKNSVAFTQALIAAEYDAELVELYAFHNQMPYRVYRDADVLEWLWLEKK